jgi:O-antigen/teichoic acid export membrane protein
MLKSILSNWLHVILSIAAVFVLYPFYVDTLGEVQYGIWIVITSTTGFFSLLQLGVPLANVRFISKYYALKDYDKINQVVSTNLAFFTGCAVVVFLFGIVLSLVLDSLFDIPSEYLKISKIATLLVCFEISLRFSFEVFEGFFHARQHFVALNIIRNLLVVVRVILTFLLVQNENGLLYVGSVLIVVALVQSLLFLLYVKKKNPYLKIRFKYINLDTFKELFSFSFFVLLMHLGSTISFKSDAIVLGSVVSVSSVVWFNIGNNLLLYLMQFMAGISSVLMPKVSQMDAAGFVSEISEIYMTYSRYVAFLILPVCLSFWCFGGDFIAIWMGEKYRVMSGSVLSILTIGYIVFLIQSSVALPILMGTSNVKYPTIAIFFSSIVNFILSVFLGREFGVYGVAWGTTIPLLILSSYLIFYMCKENKIKFLSYLIRSIILPFSSSTFFLLPGFFLIMYLTIDTFFLFFFAVSLCTTIYISFVYLIYLTKEERLFLVDKVIFIFR